MISSSKKFLLEKETYVTCFDPIQFDVYALYGPEHRVLFYSKLQSIKV
jgi:hypothetical protein